MSKDSTQSRKVRKKVSVHIISSSSDSDVEEVAFLPPATKKAKLTPQSSATCTSSSKKGNRKQVKNKSGGNASKHTCSTSKERQETFGSGNMASTTVDNVLQPTLPQQEDNNHCVICMSDIENKKTLHLCQHSFCTACIDQWFEKTNPTCPSCGVIYGMITGFQPISGQMTFSKHHDFHLPGYEQYGCIIIEYSFPNGVQTAEHPNPGQYYSGTRRIAYLPDCAEGNKVLRLLQKAFERRLVFTVGRSVTTGLDNTVVWNDIHHKTSTHGGQQGFGYPDPTYLSRVQLELASKGVTE